MSPTYRVQIYIYSTAVTDRAVTDCARRLLRGTVAVSAAHQVLHVNGHRRELCGTWEVDQFHNCTSHDFCCAGNFCGTDNVARAPTRYQCIPCTWSSNPKYTALGEYSLYACSRSSSTGIFTSTAPTALGTATPGMGYLPYPVVNAPETRPPLMLHRTPAPTSGPLMTVHTPAYVADQTYPIVPGYQGAPAEPTMPTQRPLGPPPPPPNPNLPTTPPDVRWRTIGCNQDEVLKLAQPCSVGRDPLTTVWDSCSERCRLAMVRQVTTHGCCVSSVLQPALAGAKTSLKTMYKLCGVRDPCAAGLDKIDGCMADADCLDGYKCTLQESWGRNFRACSPKVAVRRTLAPTELFRCANETAMIGDALAKVVLACNRSDAQQNSTAEIGCRGPCAVEAAKVASCLAIDVWSRSAQADAEVRAALQRCRVELRAQLGGARSGDIPLLTLRPRPASGAAAGAGPLPLSLLTGALLLTLM